MSSIPPPSREPLEDRLPDDPVAARAVVEAHRVALAGDADGYLDPKTGLFVMTAGYLWRRGECCDSGCRHCPFAGGTRVGR